MKLFIEAQAPDALAKAFLQHIRDFDTAHPGCHFYVSMQTDDMNIDALNDALDVDPPFPYRTIIKRGEP